jgi:hypothetical protein
MSYDALIARLGKLIERAEPLPWCWEQCGDKCDAPVVGVAFDRDDHPIAGELRVGENDDPDGVVRYNIASDIGHGVDGRSPSANAELIVEAVNALPRLLAALAKARAALKPFADCCDQIDAAESDDEWAKFRLLVKDYRHAREVVDCLAMTRQPILERGNCT